MATVELPLFPLSSVLFPGGSLALRIFEPRYLDLVKRCGRNGERFGVCLILAGREVGEPALPAALGTEAMIVDFNQTEDGLLGITVEGRRRFRVIRTRVRDDGLVLGDVAWLPALGSGERLRDEHALLSVLLARILDKAGIEHEGVGKGRLAEAEWVGWRLAEWLPLSQAERQHLLQEDDPHARLQRLVERLPDFQTE
ncbi:LON peptidase substrate-binding domain-containing protein [Arenimonas fontis]|uniref:ATP-dependent protease n=1 Tax=Arenimonas fontis TaxID=2608255 RepID=A0A5B2ZB53_9GAMM|nr:LON peptidase substrate-binding domain-containing protein [Arenimonas fontis]KAA2284381.1 ATP-dependent protease [Arenimonas fontis]